VRTALVLGAADVAAAAVAGAAIGWDLAGVVGVVLATGPASASRRVV